MFASCLHRCSPSSFLVKLTSGYLVLRSLTTVTSLVVVASSTSRTASSAWALLLVLLVCQLLSLLYEAGWLLVWRQPGLSRLLRQYSSYLAKVDVARGRSVPCPLNQLRSHQILPRLNPHSSSPDLTLLLDLLATRSGLGLALRCLACLEEDFSQSWAPTGLQADIGEEEVAVFWRDPVVLRYITSPAVSLHYGLELERPGTGRTRRIVSQQEVVMARQSWRKTELGDSVDLGDSDQFVYRETFQSVAAQAGCRVRVWTIVDGHLVSSKQEVFPSLRHLQQSQGSCQSLQSTGGCDGGRLDQGGFHLDREIITQNYEDSNTGPLRLRLNKGKQLSTMFSK